ncbi:MAG: tRNA (N(6)-L-threonylcarbamoyladenosine(37)-C(2))-methylthiotransferase MtaB [Clostridia bacterium]|nr:tRNA (N(6)-L-threonylcarbamoyladenosine(37)-C(2))-methylthiotransferase MtaB [Clostridia bacterium]
MTVYLHTQGCKVNQYESQAMREMLAENGYTVCEFSSTLPDIGKGIILINSCTVTGESDRKLRQFLRRCKRNHPHSILILTGCFSQAFPKEAERLEEVDIVLGNSQRKILPQILDSYFKNPQKIVCVKEHTKEYEHLSIHQFDERTRAFLKIQDGCDCFCSYCIIPFARGRNRFSTLEEIKTEVENLGRAGFKEIVLTGINLTAFGRGQGYDLADAVHVAASVSEIVRVRLGSLEPDDITPTLIEKLKGEPKLCPHFHLSLQSGCDETLKRMRRRYTSKEYKTVCQNLRDAFPGCALTTDVMVGFVGETEDEFNTSFQFVKSIGFSKIHVFPYSIRPGTKAAEEPIQLSNEVKNARARQMIAMGETCQKEFLESLIGNMETILTETTGKDGFTEGFTANYSPVKVKGIYPPNTLLPVIITDVKDLVCIGE